MKLLRWIAIKILEGGEKTMMAKLYAINIIAGRWTYKKVPNFYKEAVKQELILADAESLIIEE